MIEYHLSAITSRSLDAACFVCPFANESCKTDFFLALAGSDENVFESDFFSLCLFEVIHDDRNFRAKRSSIEIIISERGDLGLSGSFHYRSLRLICRSSSN